MTHDVVIVGGGTAGCVLAARLTEDPSRRVLLLEAGPDYPTVDALPPEVRDGWRVAFTHDWGYTSEPDARGRTLDLLRGRLMGGCSSLNAAAALRGAPADFDEWAAQGNPGWSFDEVLPYFVKLERDLDFGDESWHGSSGPLPIRRYPEPERSELSNVTLDAMYEAGLPPVDDLNGPGAVGAGPTPTNTLDGVRYSTALSYLPAARHRPNLTVRADTPVDRVVVMNGRALGVTLVGGERLDADAVVLAAGAYATPPLLLRSGVGPAHDLRELSVPVVAGLAGVGANLLDHPFLSLDMPISVPAREEPKSQVGATFHSSLEGTVVGAPALQLFMGGPWATDDDGVSLAGLAFSLVKPHSRGSVRLRSVDPGDPPRIQLGHLRAARDASMMAEAFRMARAVVQTHAFGRIATGGEVAPAPGIPDDDEAGVIAAIRATVETYHHPVGTCRMGPDPDRGDVVDSDGRVHGIDGLRVADASVMPDIPSANTNLATIMVAERIASFMADG